MIIYFDRQWNGAAGAPAFADLFSDPTPANFYLSTFNPNTVGRSLRYKIVKDVQVDLNVQGGSSNITELKHMRFFLPLKQTIQYSDTTTATPDAVLRNQLIIGFFGNRGGAETLTWDYNFVWRFTDA